MIAKYNLLGHDLRIAKSTKTRVKLVCCCCPIGKELMIVITKTDLAGLCQPTYTVESVSATPAAEPREGLSYFPETRSPSAATQYSEELSFNMRDSEDLRVVACYRNGWACDRTHWYYKYHDLSDLQQIELRNEVNRAEIPAHLGDIYVAVQGVNSLVGVDRILTQIYYQRSQHGR